ncbi:hypothetical protein HY492_03055 [Candidatus Woesearchaeota archaeon]|nr:hypothetical protein [Candidatus Woesearchaeota archaeon]
MKMHKQYHKQTVATTNYAEHRANLSQQKMYQPTVKLPRPKLNPSPLEIKAGDPRDG